jgi:arylesterase/paraoxonase
MSPDGSKVYVAATTGRKLLTYRRDASSGTLTLLDQTDLKTGVDNIELDERGDLWIGCHPQLLKFVAHAKDEKNRSPSQVLYLRHGREGGYDVREVFLNDGKEYSGSTVAGVHRDRLLVGSVFEPSILDARTTVTGKD